MSEQIDLKDAERICRETLGLSNAKGPVAKKIANAWHSGYAPSQASKDEIMRLDIGRVPFWVIDVETTGKGPPADRVIELAGVEVRGTKIHRHFTTLLNPGVEIPEFITRLTGITNQMLADAPGPEQVIPMLAQLLQGSAFVAHSSAFDWRFIKKELELLNIQAAPPIICTVRLARRLMPDLKKYDLDSVARAFRLRFKEQGSSRARHRALGDAEVTARAFIKLLRLVKPLNVNTVGELVKFQSLPYKKVNQIKEATS